MSQSEPPEGLADIIEFNNQLRIFFTALDYAKIYWQRSSLTSPDGAHKVPIGDTALDEALRYREIASDAREQILALAPRVKASLVPPANQTSNQFVIGILDDLENAWQLLRFVHCMKPNEPEKTPDLRRIHSEMHERLPALRNRLWEAWRHIGHGIQLAESSAPPEPEPRVPAEPLGTEDAGNQGGDGDAAEGQTSEIKRPSEIALKTWRLRDLEGINNQTKLAKRLAELGVPSTQGQVSRRLRKVEDYLEAGNILPEIKPLISKPDSIDPALIDMGKRQDKRTPRQRERRNPDDR